MGCKNLSLKPKKSPEQINVIDLQIIRALEEDSRTSLRKLAHRIGLSQIVVRNHVKNLEHERIILGYAPVIDATKMGYFFTAIIMIQLEGGNMAEVENEIAKEDNVLSVYEITGEFDAIIFAKFRDNAELNYFLKRMLTNRFIKRAFTLIALNSVKEFGKLI